MSNDSYWRMKARPIIDKVLADTKGQDEKVICNAIRDAYPFGERRYHPYKIWCDEVRRQRGLKGEAQMQKLSKLRQARLAEWETLYGTAVSPAAPRPDATLDVEASRNE